jgi:hypothetical protein
MTVPQNNKPLNREALRWLIQAKESPEPHLLHVLTLAHWGLENGVQGDWRDNHRSAVEEQVGVMLGWEQAVALKWLLSNPDGSDDQEEELLRDLQNADSPKRAAAAVLNAIYSRQVSVLPALQPAASELR